jgi:DNA-binding NtrC family response regulator
MPSPISPARGRILVIDDEPEIREGLEDLLVGEGYSVDLAPNATEGEKRLAAKSYDLVLLDLMMPDKSGMDVLREMRLSDTETPVFMITAYGSVEGAVQAIKLGANDFFPKPWDNEKLLIEIERMIVGQRLSQENTQLKRALKQRYNFPNIIGKSERMLRLLDLVEQVASSRSTILVTGETGTGKELIAKAIHTSSPRAEFPFVAINSGSLPSDLLESAMFGHVRGAFTSASHTKKGSFEVAHKGTIFFDEIGTISAETQAKLLRVIQEREFSPLGSNETIKVDVRILAATNADLKKMVEEGRFREDLYYRLNVINIALPPLRDRKEDIPLLSSFFFTKYCIENDKFLDASDKSVLRKPCRSSWTITGPAMCANWKMSSSAQWCWHRSSWSQSTFSLSTCSTPAAFACAAVTVNRCLSMHRFSRSSRIMSAASSSSGSKRPTGARPRLPTICVYRSPPSIKRSNASQSRLKRKLSQRLF